MSCPATRNSPRSGRSRAAIRCRSVDLPHPEGPTTATNSPCSTRRSRPSSATMRPPSYALTSPLASIIGCSLMAESLHRRQPDGTERRIQRSGERDDDGDEQRPHEDRRLVARLQERAHGGEERDRAGPCDGDGDPGGGGDEAESERLADDHPHDAGAAPADG